MSEVYCPKCNVRVPVATSKRIEAYYVRYHYCKCGYKATTTAKADNVWQRKSSIVESGNTTK